MKDEAVMMNIANFPTNRPKLVESILMLFRCNIIHSQSDCIEIQFSTAAEAHEAITLFNKRVREDK